MNVAADAQDLGPDEILLLIMLSGITVVWFIKVLRCSIRDFRHYQQLRVARSGHQFTNKGDFEQAIATFTLAIEQQANPVDALLGRSHVYLLKKQWDLAFVDLNHAIELDPQNDTAYCNRAVVHCFRHEYAQAVADYSKAIELQPTCVTAVFNRAFTRVWYEGGDYVTAIADFSSVIRLAPQDATAYFYRGWFRLLEKQFEQAIADLTRAIELKYDSLDAYAQRATALMHFGQFERAVIDFTYVINRDPKHGLALNNLAWIRATCPLPQFRDGTQAVEYATRSCEILKYGVWYCLGTLAAAYAETGQFAEAVKWAGESLSLAPDDEQEGCLEQIRLYEVNQPYRIPGYDSCR